MTPTPPPPPAPAAVSNQVRMWQLISAVLALLVVTLLITAIALRARADSAVRTADAATKKTSELEASNGQLSQRNEQLFTQLSASNERLAGITGKIRIPASDRDITAQKVQSAVDAWNSASSAAQKAQAQLRLAQICSAAGVRALTDIHAGADIESGGDKAASVMEQALPACQAALG